jgi:hypothetical protein
MMKNFRMRLVNHRAGTCVVVMTAMAGFIVPAHVLADCPELEQLQSAYFGASQRVLQHSTKPSPWVPLPPPARELCESYRRLSEATKAGVEHARQAGELLLLRHKLPNPGQVYRRQT